MMESIVGPQIGDRIATFSKNGEKITKTFKTGMSINNNLLK